MPLFVLAHFGHHLVHALTVPLSPFIRDDFALDYTKAGGLFSAFSLANGFSQLPGGWLADRIGPRILVTIGICGVALAGLFVGLSHTYIMLVVFLVLMGVASGGYHPASAPLISASVKPENRGRALGFHQIGGSASFFLAPLIAAAVAAAWGWRASYIVVAVPITALGIVLCILLGRLGYAKKAERKTSKTSIGAPSALGHMRRLVAFLILATTTQAVVYSTGSFIPLFMVDHFGVSEATAAASVAIIYSAGFWAAPLGGYLSDRLGTVPVMLVVSLIAGPVIYLLNLAPYGLAFGAILLLVGMVNSMRRPISEAYIIGRTSERNRSTVLGIFYFATGEVGAVLTPLIGWLIDRFGFYTSFTAVGAAVVAVTLACSIFLGGSEDLLSPE